MQRSGTRTRAIRIHYAYFAMRPDRQLEVPPVILASCARRPAGRSPSSPAMRSRDDQRQHAIVAALPSQLRDDARHRRRKEVDDAQHRAEQARPVEIARRCQRAAFPSRLISSKMPSWRIEVGQRDEGAAGMVDADEGGVGDDVQRLRAAIFGMRTPADVGEQAGGLADSAPRPRSRRCRRRRRSIRRSSRQARGHGSPNAP